MSVTGDECEGTRSYIAPELLYPTKFDLSSCQVSKQADIYAFGIVVYEVLTGRPPFGVRQHQEITLLVLEGKRPTKPENAEDIGFGEGTWELVQQCGTKSEGNDRRWIRCPNISSVWQKIRRLLPPDLRHPPTPRQKPRLTPYPLVPPKISISAFLSLRTQSSSHAKFTVRLFLRSRRGASIPQQTRLTVGPMNSGGVPPLAPCA